MGWSFVNCQGNNSASASSLTTATWSATQGHLAVAVIAMFTQTLSTCTDANGQALTVQTVVTNGGKLYIAYLLGITASNASYSISVSCTGGPNELSIVGASFNPGAGATVVLDKTNTATGNSTAPSVSVASVTAGALVIGGATPGGSGAPTAGSGYTIPTNGAQPSNGDTNTHQPAFFEYLTSLSAGGGSTTVNMTVGAGTWAIRGTSFNSVGGLGTPLVFPSQGPSYAI